MLIDIFNTLVKGLTVTVEVTVLAGLLAAAVAILAGTCRLSQRRSVRVGSGAYIEFFRGTSALVQLYLLYFALPLVGVSVSALMAGVIVIGLNVGSYGAEAVRGAVLSVPTGQREAATVLGFSRWAQFRHVVFPQALIVLLPAAGNLLIDTLKLTSLVSLVTLSDVTFQGQQLRLNGSSPVAVFGVMLAVYLGLSSIIASGIAWLERRARRGLHVA